MAEFKFKDRPEGVAKLKELGFHAEDDFNISYVHPDGELPPGYPVDKHFKNPKPIGGIDRDGLLSLWEDLSDPIMIECRERIKKALDLSAKSASDSTQQ